MTVSRRPAMHRLLEDERGIALVVALMVSSLMLALAGALILTTMIERRIAGNFGQDAEARYAAEAGVERAVLDLVAFPDWNAILSGAARSTFVDGPPSGVRTMPGGSKLDLDDATSLLRCGKPACDAADLAAVTELRPWGNNNPVWQLYAYGPLQGLLPAGAIDSKLYVVVWIADDSSENDDDPLRDGGVPAGCDSVKDPSCAERNGGRGVVEMVARAFGPDGTQRAVAVTVGRTDTTRVLSWREVR